MRLAVVVMAVSGLVGWKLKTLTKSMLIILPKGDNYAFFTYNEDTKFAAIFKAGN